VARVGGSWGALQGLVGKSEGKNPLEDLDVDGNKILKHNFNKWGKVQWSDLAQDRDNSRVFVNTVMNRKVS
jgi:hypothetical protein